MVLAALAFLVGVVFVQFFAELPAFSHLFPAVLPAAALFIFPVRPGPANVRLLVRTGIFVIAGVFWATWRAQLYLDHLLPETLAGVELQVTGVIEDIPLERDGVQRFVFSVRHFETDVGISTTPRKLKLSWYYGEKVNAGETWRFLVRLKPPHGFLNPGGFDYEAWLYQKGIHATGYVRKSAANRRLEQPSGISVDAVRQALSARIQHGLRHSELAGLVTALAVGDRSPIGQRHWDQLISTGTNHLMAISGLHIGLAAGFGYWIARRAIPARIMQRRPAQQLAVLAGLLLAVIYALLAGFSVPTQRALLMLGCVTTAFMLKRNIRPLDALAAALIAVLVFDPASVLTAGFWFSFLAVSVIYYVFCGRIGRRRGWRQWGLLQFSIALALFPVSLMMFQQASLVSPFANFILVPYISLLVVPLVLASVIIMPLVEGLSLLLLSGAAGLLELIWPLITALSEARYAYWVQAGSSITAVGLAMAGVLVLLAPRGIPARWLGFVLILPIMLQVPQRPVQGAYTLDLLDVGQGLAAVIRTAEHTLLFDSGARFSSRLDSGDAVVVPFFRQLSITRLDRMVISHGDADHIGGAASVLEAYPAAELIGQEIDDLDALHKSACLRGKKWQWDGVEFEFLHPGEQVYRKPNNRSCVLKITGRGGRLLLTGDIEKKIERLLIRRYGEELRSEVLVVPHHGSNSSSSEGFVRAVSPDVVLFSAGYRNRYQLPNSKIVERYRSKGAKLLSSGHSGAIRVLFDPDTGVQLLHEYRRKYARYWNHRPVPQWP